MPPPRGVTSVGFGGADCAQTGAAKPKHNAAHAVHFFAIDGFIRALLIGTGSGRNGVLCSRGWLMEVNLTHEAGALAAHVERTAETIPQS